MLSLCGMAHFDYRQPGNYSYEQAVQVMRRLGLSMFDREQLFTRAVFNVIGCNRDDHVKNISFLMDRRGVWRLSPAYDLSYAWNPDGPWTNLHQMSVNGRREGITREDLISLASCADIKSTLADDIIDRVWNTFSRWSEFADTAGIGEVRMDQVRKGLRVQF
jgi:serine/threonine-protein kinase HipA